VICFLTACDGNSGNSSDTTFYGSYDLLSFTIYAANSTEPDYQLQAPQDGSGQYIFEKNAKFTLYVDGSSATEPLCLKIVGSYELAEETHSIAMLPAGFSTAGCPGMEQQVNVEPFNLTYSLTPTTTGTQIQMETEDDITVVNILTLSGKKILIGVKQ
jgi:hypothetical protein